jgi:DNA-directed RNA polymerase specialized sigma24 family protein
MSPVEKITPANVDEALTLAMQLDAQSPETVRDQAIVEAIQRYQIPITRFIRSHVQDVHMREDLAQDVWAVFTKAVKEGRFHDRAIDPLHYLIRMARIRVAHYHSRDPRFRHPEVPLLEEDLLERIVSGDDIAAADLRLELDQYISAALGKMTDEEQEVARLWRQGYSPCEIADYTDKEYRAAWKLTNRVVTLISRAAQYIFVG